MTRQKAESQKQAQRKGKQTREIFVINKGDVLNAIHNIKRAHGHKNKIQKEMRTLFFMFFALQKGKKSSKDRRRFIMGQETMTTFFSPALRRIMDFRANLHGCVFTPNANEARD